MYTSRIAYNRKKRNEKIKNAVGMIIITLSVTFFASVMSYSLSNQAAHDYYGYKASQI